MAALCAIAGGCADNAKSRRGGKPAIYTSFYAMYRFTLSIAGDKADVTNLVPPGSEPHDWEPTTKDMASLSGADLFIYNGAGMEGFIDNLKQNLSGVTFVDASAGIPVISATQPHIWLDPALAKQQLQTIAAAVEATDPANKTYYENNLNTLEAKLDALDAEYARAARAFARRDIVVAHNAYAYLCKRYNINMIALDENGGGQEPSPAFMARTVDYMRQNGINYVFKDELDSPKVVDTIANETGAHVLTLYTFEGAPQGGQPADYFACMEKNLAALKTALD